MRRSSCQMPFQITDINRRITASPEKFVSDCDAHFDALLSEAAEKLCDNLQNSPVVLLAGPSGSGKTTTAQKLDEKLEMRGIGTHVISLDNYFITVEPGKIPLTEDGQYDFESPKCLDMPLLQDHFRRLAHGEEVMIPYFDFMERRQHLDSGTLLRLGRDEIVIFEGIHALNGEVNGNPPGAMKLFISAESDVMSGDRLLFPDEWARFLRRLVRDYQFRNTTADETIDMWDNVRRGELMFVRPFVSSADIFIDTAHGYDIPVLASYAIPLLEDLPDDTRYDDYRWLPGVMRKFETIDESYIRPEALIREFIGGGIYEY